MKKALSLLVLLLLCANFVSVQAQNDFIQFEKITHDFGTIKEDDGDVSYTYNFKNVTDSPIQLIYVKAPCGCTTPSWTEEVIPAGGTGSVTAKYGVANRPGYFKKDVSVRAAKVNPVTGTVTDSLTADSEVLTFTGTVIPRQKGPKDWYPIEDKNVRFSTNHVAFGEIYTHETRTKEIVVYNQGDSPIRFTNVDVKAHIIFDFQGQTTVNPKDSIKIKVTYEAGKANDWDFLHERAYLSTDTDSVKTVYISATVKEDYSKLTDEQKANAPKVEFEKTVHDFGTIYSDGGVQTTYFTFTNKGKTPLKVLKTKASCGCTAGKPDKDILQPGESSQIKVSFSPYGKSGQNSKSVTVVTNDPENHKISLEIKSNILEGKGGSEGH